MIKFDLYRDEDASGLSGTGHIATGCVFKDGSVAMRWLTRVATTTFYACLADVFYLHGHDGKTRIVPESGYLACSQTGGANEVAWAHQVDGVWVLDTLTDYRHRAHFDTKRVDGHADGRACAQHAATWVAQGVMEGGGGELYTTWDVKTTNPPLRDDDTEHER